MEKVISLRLCNGFRCEAALMSALALPWLAAWIGFQECADL